MNTISSGIPLITFPKTTSLHIYSIMDHVFALFPDHYPVVVAENPDNWVIGLQWSKDPRWYVDPNVTQVAAKLYGINLEKVTSFYQLDWCYKTSIVFSMFHSRALLAPSYANSQHGIKPFNYIVHIDDHTDLMPSLLYVDKEKGVLQDSVFNQAIDVTSPESVVAAIDRGIINKGNFLTTYLLANQPAVLVHVSQNLQEREFWLEVTSSNLILEGKLFYKTGFAFRSNEQPDSWHLRQTTVLPNNLSIAGNDTIWLDIDMDAFCNRYNGDSDKATESLTTAEQKETMRRIDNFLYGLSHVSWLAHVKAVSIAVSPGFFPTEYWEYTIPKVYEEVKRVICRSWKHA